MSEAHKLGMNTSVTMLIGHIEDISDRITDAICAGFGRGRTGQLANAPGELHSIYSLDVSASEKLRRWIRKRQEMEAGERAVFL